MKAILPQMGFTENSGYASGIEEIWFRDLRPLASENLTVYHPQEWDKNPDHLLSQMRRLHITQVMLISYSWGAGYGAINFARKARQYGIKIPIACFCDPVYRSRFFPHWIPINPLSLTRIPKIKIPVSIDTVYWVRQCVNRPAGHDLVAENPLLTTIHEPEVLIAPHGQIDEHPRWQQLIQDRSKWFANLEE